MGNHITFNLLLLSTYLVSEFFIRIGTQLNFEIFYPIQSRFKKKIFVFSPPFHCFSRQYFLWATLFDENEWECSKNQLLDETEKLSNFCFICYAFVMLVFLCYFLFFSFISYMHFMRWFYSEPFPFLKINLWDWPWKISLSFTFSFSE